MEVMKMTMKNLLLNFKNFFDILPSINNTMKPKILFICKMRGGFYGPSFGLINSCRFVSNALSKQGIQSKVVSVVDNSFIDKEVYDYKPTHVFIEALWVVPSKFKELISLHPKVKWYVRIHSKIPFLAHEGMAMDWLRQYNELSIEYPKFHTASNSNIVVETFDVCYKTKIDYFPNIYEPPKYSHDSFLKEEKNKVVNIGCFGAIRPMKNQLNQALAAISFANELGLKLYFHINSDRCETNGDPILKNLIYSFKDTKHKLIFHKWMNHKEFIDIVRQMDIGLQVSLSETFNIVAADFVYNDIPLIGSDEIEWLDRKYKANPNSIESIIDKLRFAYKGKNHNIQKVNKELLEKYNKKSIKIWLDTL